MRWLQLIETDAACMLIKTKTADLHSHIILLTFCENIKICASGSPVPGSASCSLKWRGQGGSSHLRSFDYTHIHKHICIHKQNLKSTTLNAKNFFFINLYITLHLVIFLGHNASIFKCVFK